jgi:acetyltransferase-like isoleucine patch superfamily enzyme
VRTLPPAVQPVADSVFAARRAWYRRRYPNLVVGDGVLFIGKLRLRGGTRLVLGDDVRVRQEVIVNGGGTVTVGHDTLLNGCWIGAADRVDVGAWCLVSDCNISDTDYHNLLPAQRHTALTPKAVSPVTLGRNVWVGARAIVLKGTTVGDDTVIGSGAVVRGTVPAGVVVAGNPAVVVRTFAPDERTAEGDDLRSPDLDRPDGRISTSEGTSEGSGQLP